MGSLFDFMAEWLNDFNSKGCGCGCFVVFVVIDLIFFLLFGIAF